MHVFTELWDMTAAYSTHFIYYSHTFAMDPPNIIISVLDHLLIVYSKAYKTALCSNIWG